LQSDRSSAVSDHLRIGQITLGSGYGAPTSTVHDPVTIPCGANRFTGDLHEYRIQATAGELSVDVLARPLGATGQITGLCKPRHRHHELMYFGPSRLLRFTSAGGTF
jgi:hypothetical protein